MRLPAFVCLSVCLLARLGYSKKACMHDLHEMLRVDRCQVWTNWLTFEPDPNPDAKTGLLSPISYALQRGILLRRENLRYRYWASVAAVTHGFKMVLFTASRGNNFVGGTCAPPSAILVLSYVTTIGYWRLHTTSFTISLRNTSSEHAIGYLFKTWYELPVSQLFLTIN